MGNITHNADGAGCLPNFLIIFNFTPRAARIQQYRPDARLLLLLRQPADRAYSQYLFARRLGWEPAPTFAAALADEGRRKAEDWFPFFTHATLLDLLARRVAPPDLLRAGSTGT